MTDSEEGEPRLLLHEVCSAGPVAVYYAEEKEIHYEKRSSELESATSLAVQIYHGWQPLLLSTAYFFSRIVCQTRAPVIISGPITVTMIGDNIQVYLLAKCEIIRKKGNNTVVEKEVNCCNVPTSETVNIFAAPRAREFGDSVEADIVTDGMTVYCQGGQEISYTSSASGTIIHVNGNK